MHAFLFDLDGTLLDTAPDMALALNHLREQHGKPPLDLAAVRPLISGGSPPLLKLAFGVDRDHPTYPELRQSFLDGYANQLRVHTDLFEGVDQVLTHLEQRGIPWGIVTNKPGFLAEPLVALCDLAKRTQVLVCGDTLAHSKPHPAPIEHACEQIGISPNKTYFVGDHFHDIRAGNAAGATTITALYGYIPEGENPKDWGAHGEIQAPLELLEWV